MDNGIKTGRYRHYKGKDYIVFGTARHSETEEPMVVYRTDYGKKDHWVRPLDMFTETIDIEGQPKPRFEWVSES